MSKGKRVAVYLRVSTSEQNTDLQRRDILEFVAARGWTISRIYEDKATGTNAKRPMLMEMVKDARSRRLDLIVCWKLDRLFRSLKDLIATLQEFSDLGVEFVSLKDNVDLTTSAGRLMVHIIGAFAEFEASLIKERVRAGLGAAKAKGKRLGRPKKRNDDMIRLLRAQGLSIRKIASQLKLSKGSVQKAIVGWTQIPLETIVVTV